MATQYLCTAGYLRYEVDQVINQGAIAEAGDATDKLQDVGAEPQEYNEEYVRPEEIEFVPISLSCLMCKGEVGVSKNGDVLTSGCLVSGSCEIFWIDTYPEEYIDKDGQPVSDFLPCIGGDACKAVIKMEIVDGRLVWTLIGQCAIKVESDKLAEGLKLFDSGKVTRPEDGIAKFDGEEGFE